MIRLHYGTTHLKTTHTNQCQTFDVNQYDASNNFSSSGSTCNSRNLRNLTIVNQRNISVQQNKAKNFKIILKIISDLAPAGVEILIGTLIKSTKENSLFNKIAPRESNVEP